MLRTEVACYGATARFADVGDGSSSSPADGRAINLKAEHAHVSIASKRTR